MSWKHYVPIFGPEPETTDQACIRSLILATSVAIGAGVLAQHIIDMNVEKTEETVDAVSKLFEL